MALLLAIEQLAGFCGAGLLVNRGSGRAVSSVTYDGLAAIRQTRAPAATLRVDDTQDAGTEVVDVKRVRAGHRPPARAGDGLARCLRVARVDGRSISHTLAVSGG
jgi:hypothetical protein